MIYVVIALLIIMFAFEWWVFVVLHNMVQGLYRKDDE